MLPGFLHCLDMFWFSYWWSKAIGCPKFLNKECIMNVWVLTRYWIPIGANVIKNAAFNMQFSNSGIDSKNVILSYDVMADKIAKLHKGAYCTHHLHWNMPCNGRKINLQCWVSTTVRITKILNHTFISAFESSPVHCLNPWPSGKQWRPGNEGAAAILKVSDELSLSK